MCPYNRTFHVCYWVECSMLIISSWLIMLDLLYPYWFSPVVLSISGRGALMSPTIIVDLSIFPFVPVYFCFTYLEALLLAVNTFRVMCF